MKTSEKKSTHINDLGTNLLALIFSYFVDLPTLDTCYDVCLEWEDAVKQRMSKFRYVLDNSMDMKKVESLPPNTLIVNVKKLLANDTFLKLFQYLNPNFIPNVKFIDLRFIVAIDSMKLIRDCVLSLSKQLRGIVDAYDYLDPRATYCIYLENLELFHSHHLDPYICSPEFGPKLRQLSIFAGSLSILVNNTRYLYNLERLFYEAIEGWVDGCKGKAELPNLKVLILAEKQPPNLLAGQPMDQSVGLEFMDLCPNLVSARMRLPGRDVDKFVVNENIKNYNLKDLIIEYTSMGVEQKWDTIRKTLLKFPCLQRLAIKSNPHIVDENIQEILDLLPELKALNILNCTRTSWSVGYLIDAHCSKNNCKMIFVGNRGDYWDLRYDTEKYSKENYLKLVQGSIMDDDFFAPSYLIPRLIDDHKFADKPQIELIASE